MLETTAIPVLLKAVNFLFDECGKILEERRERRKQEQPKIEPPKPEAPAIPSQQSISNKEMALSISVNQLAWTKAESQVEHFLSLLDIHIGNYRLLSKQYAAWTEVLVPPVIANSLKNEEAKIIAIASKLQTLLSEVYARDVNALNQEDIESGG